MQDQPDAYWMRPRPQRIELSGSLRLVVEHRPSHQPRYDPSFGRQIPRSNRKGNPVQYTLADDREVIVTLSPVPDAEGNTDPTVPTWSSNNPAIVTVTPVESDPTGLSALISGPFPQPLGQAQIQAVGAPGSAPFVLDVTVVPDLAETGFAATFGPTTTRTNIPPEPSPAP